MFFFPNFQHRFKLLTSQRIRSIMRCNDIENIQRYDFPSILQERVPGTPGHEEVKEVSSYVLCVLAGCCVTQYMVLASFLLLHQSIVFLPTVSTAVLQSSYSVHNTSLNTG